MSFSCRVWLCCQEAQSAENPESFRFFDGFGFDSVVGLGEPRFGFTRPPDLASSHRGRRWKFESFDHALYCPLGTFENLSHTSLGDIIVIEVNDGDDTLYFAVLPHQSRIAY